MTKKIAKTKTAKKEIVNPAADISMTVEKPITKGEAVKLANRFAELKTEIKESNSECKGIYDKLLAYMVENKIPAYDLDKARIYPNRPNSTKFDIPAIMALVEDKSTEYTEEDFINMINVGVEKATKILSKNDYTNVHTVVTGDWKLVCDLKKETKFD